MLLTHCQITILLEVNHQGVGLACLAQKPNAPNWIVVDCRVSTLGDCSTIRTAWQPAMQSFIWSFNVIHGW